MAVAVLCLKLLAWRMTGSVALFSDAMESLVNVAAAAMAWFAIRLAERPPDENHPFGHHKAENLSAVVEGFLIVLAALAVIWEAVPVLTAPSLAGLDVPGLLVNGAAMVLNGIWAQVLIRAGRRRRSPALQASGRHLMSDVWTSAGVIAGLILALVTGWAVLDPLLAILVALNILREGAEVIVASGSDLMDSAAGAEDREAIDRIVRETATGALQVHDIRTRRAGQALFVEFHLVVAHDMTVGQSHRICDALERAIRAKIPSSRTTIHVEPDDKLEDDGIEPASPGEPPDRRGD